MASVIDRSSNQVGVSNPTVPGNIDDRPRSRSLATALFEGARASGCAYVELHHSKGHDLPLPKRRNNTVAGEGRENVFMAKIL